MLQEFRNLKFWRAMHKNWDYKAKITGCTEVLNFSIIFQGDPILTGKKNISSYATLLIVHVLVFRTLPTQTKKKQKRINTENIDSTISETNTSKEIATRS